MQGKVEPKERQQTGRHTSGASQRQEEARVVEWDEPNREEQETGQRIIMARTWRAQ